MNVIISFNYYLLATYLLPNSMTLLQPSKSNPFLTKIIFGLVAALLLEALWLVMLYNHVVNAQHAIVAAQNDIRAMETRSAELKDKIFTLFSTQELESFASAHGLVSDRNPHYLEVQIAQKPAER